MTSTNQDFTMWSGDTKKLRVQVTEDGNGRDPVSLTGADIEWVLGNQDIQKDNTGNNGGISITDATEGVFEITLDPADTDALVGDYEHEAQMTDSSDNITTILVGTARIMEDKI